MSSFGLQYPDNATLFTGTLTTTGAGPAIDTTGYVQSVWQLSGNSFSGIITVENSLDGVYWTPTFVTELASLGQKSQIEVDGVYLVKADSRYIRYNVTNISGTATLLILGNNYLSSNPVDRVSLAMDETNNSPLNIKFQPQNSGIKQDLSGAFILSDAPTTQTISVPNIGTVTIIDTQGYQSLQITTGLYAGSLSGSNDSIGTYVAILGYNLTTISSINAVTASGNFSIPITTRYIKLTCTAAGPFTYSLRNIASPAVPALNYIAGTAVSATAAQLGVAVINMGASNPVISGGVLGTLGVGGTNAVGTASSQNPLIVGGVDPTGLARRATTTMLGDLITGNRTIPTSSAALSSANTGNTPVAVAGYNNQIGLSVQDTTQFEGQTQTELLAQILLELKILNQQIFELPRVQAAALQGPTVAQQGPIVTLGDEPTQMRNDASLFDKQQ